MKVIVTIDKREKRPLRFPKSMKWHPYRSGKATTLLVQTQSKVMPEGDYALKGFEETCIIERKGSLKELADNLLGMDYRRAMDAFNRLAGSTSHAYLMVECTPTELRNPGRYVYEPARVVDALAALIERNDLRLILCGRVRDAKQKLVVGELMLRLMMAHAYRQEEDYSGVDDVLSDLQK